MLDAPLPIDTPAHVLRLPSLLARQLLGQPIGQRTGAGITDLLAFELVDGLDRRIPRHADADERNRPRGFADGDHRRALGDQRHFGPGAVADVECAGGHCLSHSAAAGEVDDLEVEPVFLEDAELLADIDRNDRVGVRRRLADRKRC